MLIECEACQTHYEIGADFPAGGRKVKCARCEHVWLAVPVDKPVEDTEAEEEQTDIAPSDQDLDIDKLVLSPPEIPPLEPESFGAMDFEDIEFQEFEEKAPEENQDEPDEEDVEVEEEVAQSELPEEEIKADEEEPPAIEDEDKEPDLETEPEPEEDDNESEQDVIQEPEIVEEPVLEADSENDPAEDEAPAEDVAAQEEPEDIADAAEKEVELEAEATEETEEEDKLEDWKLPAPEAVVGSSQPAKTGPSRIVVMLSWLMFTGVVLSLIGGSYTYRTEVVKILPAAADLYELFGESINVRGLTFEEVRYEWIEKNGEPVVAIQGVVKNLTGDRKPIPRLRLAFRNADNQDIVLWSKQLTDANVAAHQSKPFEVIVPAPPKEAQSLQILFAK